MVKERFIRWATVDFNEDYESWSVEEVELRIKALTGDMSKTAQLLISETGVISDASTEVSGEIEYDFNKHGEEDI